MTLCMGIEAGAYPEVAGLPAGELPPGADIESRAPAAIAAWVAKHGVDRAADALLEHVDQQGHSDFSQAVADALLVQSDR